MSTVLFIVLSLRASQSMQVSGLHGPAPCFMPPRVRRRGSSGSFTGGLAPGGQVERLGQHQVAVRLGGGRSLRRQAERHAIEPRQPSRPAIGPRNSPNRHIAGRIAAEEVDQAAPVRGVAFSCGFDTASTMSRWVSSMVSTPWVPLIATEKDLDAVETAFKRLVISSRAAGESWPLTVCRRRG